MGFETLSQSELKANTRPELPLGTYTFELAGANVRQNERQGWEELSLRFVVAEGEHAGVNVFGNYPDPAATSKNGKSMAVMGGALKKLEIALGMDAVTGESTLDYYKRVASQRPRVQAQMVPERTIRQGETEPRPTFGIFTVAPSA